MVKSIDETYKTFIFIFGPQAVGKMSTGLAIKERTGFRLLYNHQTIDIAESLFDRGSKNYVKALFRLNMLLFSRFIDSNPSTGMIYTDVWMLNRDYDCIAKHEMLSLFKKNGWKVYLIELTSTLEVRIKRNSSETRLEHKPSKRNIKFSQEHLVDAESTYTLNSFHHKSWVKPSSVDKHIVLDNSHLTAEEAANYIISQLHV